MDSQKEQSVHSLSKERTRKYILFLVFFMAMVAIMDQYLSFIETTAIPYILEEYSVTDTHYSWWKSVYFIPTLLVFLLNGLNDIIGRKKTILILILIFGLASFGIVFFTPTFHMFMLFLAIITFAAVSNIWTIPISEEAPAERRAKYASIVYFISLIPLQAIIPPLLDRMNLSWKWMYGFIFLLMIPILIMWLFMKETKRFEEIKEGRKKDKIKHKYFGFGDINRRDLKYIIFSSIIWMTGLIVTMLLVWAGHYFRDIHGYSLDQWSLILLGGLSFMMIGTLFGGWTMDKLGRKTGLIIGSIGLGFFLALIGILPFSVSPFAMVFSGFFMGFSYTWIITFVPEIFPTDRRGTCMGLTTSIARISYVIGPALAAILLTISPTMELFWITAGIISIIPIAFIILFHPYETKQKELEIIETAR
jgi:MFS family permease